MSDYPKGRKSSETSDQRRARTAAARKAFQEKFANEEERVSFYREIGQKGNEGRIVLNANEAAVLLEAYALLNRIVERVRTEPQPSNDASDPA